MTHPSKQLFTHTFQDPIYALSWSYRKDKPFRLATCSYCEKGDNIIQILSLEQEDSEIQKDITRFDTKNEPKDKETFETSDESSSEALQVTHSVRQEYPSTKLMFMPDISPSRMDLLISSGYGLNVWNVRKDGKLDLTSVLSTSENGLNSPLTSFDWCAKDLHQVGTSSIETMVTIWDISVGKPKSRIIAHDKEVYDIAFQDQFVFGTVGADGSARVFDMRDLKTSTIVHETSNPLLRLSWNQQSPNFFATFEMDSSKIIIMDIRNMESTYVVCELDNGHTAPVNAIQWAPHSWCHLSSAGEDGQVLIWDLYKIPKPIEEPILSYTAPSSVQQLQWSALHPHWIAVASEKQLQLLKV